MREKGSAQQKQLILGAAFKAGLEKVTVPIFEYGIPVEYELVRSINTVASGKRKRIGVVATDARLMGGTVMQGMSMQQVSRHLLIEELQKQYEVEEVDLSVPVAPDNYDALIAVQPSSLDPQSFGRFLDAVRSGIPVAIFEDPAPVGTGYITPTGSPKQSPGSMFGGGGMTPKGEIRELWDLLELDVPGTPGMQGMFTPDLVWQQHNPYPTLDDQANELWVFIDEDSPGATEGQALSADSPITSGMKEVLAIMTGAVNAKPGGSLQHTPLLSTGELSGYIAGSKLGNILQGRTTVTREAEGIVPFVPIAMSIEGTPTPENKPGEGSEQESSGASHPSRLRGGLRLDAARVFHDSG